MSDPILNLVVARTTYRDQTTATFFIQSPPDLAEFTASDPETGDVRRFTRQPDGRFLETL